MFAGLQIRWSFKGDNFSPFSQEKWDCDLSLEVSPQDGFKERSQHTFHGDIKNYLSPSYLEHCVIIGQNGHFGP